jgi:hypothetical protein
VRAAEKLNTKGKNPKHTQIVDEKFITFQNRI